MRAQPFYGAARVAAGVVAVLVLVAIVAGSVIAATTGAGLDTRRDGEPPAVEVPEAILEEMRRSTDCESLRHEAEVMRGRVDRGADGPIDRAVLEVAAARMVELDCEPT
jgi:hypothetical protein